MKKSLHIVVTKSMDMNQVESIVAKHCEGEDSTVRLFCLSLARTLRDNPHIEYKVDHHGVKCARATNSSPDIIIDCLDM